MTDRKSYTCGFCHKVGHNKRTCRLRKEGKHPHPYKRSNQRKCSKCGMIGHNQRTCDYDVDLQAAQTIQLEKWLYSKKKTTPTPMPRNAPPSDKLLDRNPRPKLRMKYKKFDRKEKAKEPKTQPKTKISKKYRVKERYRVKFKEYGDDTISTCPLSCLSFYAVLPEVKTRRTLF